MQNLAPRGLLQYLPARDPENAEFHGRDVEQLPRVAFQARVLSFAVADGDFLRELKQQGYAGERQTKNYLAAREVCDEKEECGGV